MKDTNQRNPRLKAPKACTNHYEDDFHCITRENYLDFVV
jgi:hypothetical protein